MDECCPKVLRAVVDGGQRLKVRTGVGTREEFVLHRVEECRCDRYGSEKRADSLAELTLV